ncbi:MAG TPA: LysR family transcriptional regulator [Pyrinomonadaceae bacterium]|jgi:DNA-binding transcriptional LysR family regulator
MNESYSLYPFHVFRLVARLGSVTRAASELFISQPAVSAHLKAVERRFGETLFERTPRGMTLTSVGRDVLEQIDRLFALYEELPDVVEASRGRIRGEVSLAASSTPGTYLVPRLLRQFQGQYPEAKTNLMVGGTAKVLQWLQEYRAPLGIIGETREGENLHKLKIGCDIMSLVTAPDNPIAEIENLQPEDLCSQTLFIRESGSSTREAARTVLGDLLPAFGRILEIPNNETIKQSVAAGLGVAVLSSWSIELEQKAGRLICAADARFQKYRNFYLVRREDRTLTGIAAVMWEYLKQCRTEIPSSES